MDCPECEELKTSYTSCIKSYASNRLFQWDYKSSGAGTTDINQCDEPFQDYKACVETAMRLKIEKLQKKR